jgi:DNA processing protein
MSPYGRWAASRIASGLARQGFTIVSGLARGIDAAAHRAALDAGGRTVAVLPGGADVLYPPEHAPLADQIVSRGALVTEYLPGTPVVPGNFPARNRLIAAMAVATVVVEAGLRSGALITAGFALQEGREVMAVPGRAGDPGSGGVHALIRDGAALVETASDVVSALPIWSRPSRSVDAGARPQGQSSNVSPADRLIRLLAGGPLTEQALIEGSGNPAAQVRAALVMLEMEDRLDRLPGAIYVTRAPDDRSRVAEVSSCQDP